VALLLMAGSRIGAASEEVFVVVRRGDTLFRIARTFATTVDRLRSDNDLHGDVIRPGQRLVLHGTRGVRPSAKGPGQVAAPMEGLHRRDVAVGYGVHRNVRHKRVMERHTGLDLRGRTGTPVLACADGVVRFVGDLQGFGRVVILEHDGSWRSVYAPLDPDRLEVAPGQGVWTGQVLGRLGEPVEGDTSALHFELRRQDAAVDPLPLIRW
jgi:murein DD-endopeptidase MepM/ murein hydrolase activator NlpD